MKIQILTSLPQKLLGLSFKENIKPVYYETRFGIHTFFVKKAIDVVICDDDFIVRKIVRSMKPWKVLIWNPKYKKVLELPVNYKKYSKIIIGDKIDIT